ncbi:MAG TPA: DUF982 domain-containing protein [Phyllobacterium sp.]|nr:DUF982 domain-containing protein [Phyllobacterium sp.]
MDDVPDVQIRWIAIATQKLGVSRTLTSVNGLAEYLLRDWPVEHGGEHLMAQKACLRALQGKVQGDTARKAFVRACEEAGIFIFPEDRVGGRGTGKGKTKR